MKRLPMISVATALALAASAVPAIAQQQGQGRPEVKHQDHGEHGRPAAQPQHPAPQHAQPERGQPRPTPPRAAPESHVVAAPERPVVAPAPRPAPQVRQEPMSRAEPRAEPHSQPRYQPTERSRPMPETRATPVAPGRPGVAVYSGRPRVSQQQERQRIYEDQRRASVYRDHLADQTRRLQQESARLREQRRMQQYRFEQDYIRELELQRQRLAAERNYENDPYYYSPYTYRYLRGGQYYETNQYGAALLRQAVNYGYQEGVRAGQADRLDGWAPDYLNSYAYQDANYGYTGLYVNQADYNYYFRQGFQRGYNDGYYNRFQYGTNVNGNYSILGNLLTSILGLQTLP